MKIVVCFSLLWLMSPLAYGQMRVIKDLDNDGRQDTVTYTPGSGVVICRLSTKNQPVKGDFILPPNGKERITETSNGLGITVNGMRWGYAARYRYEPTTKKMRLIGMRKYNFGPASGDGSGHCSVNLLTDDFIGKWNYFDIKSDSLYQLPAVKSELYLPKIYLSTSEVRAFGKFMDKADALRSFARLKMRSNLTDKDLSWTGTISGDIPVFVHFHITNVSYGSWGKLVVGSITYLNTSKKRPIPLLGYEDGTMVHLREYNPKGMITGILSLTPSIDGLKGNWMKPGRTSGYKIALQPSDSIIPSKSIQTTPKHIFGQYRYAYGKTGYRGDVEIKQINDNQAVLSMFSVTSAPGRNMADGGNNDTIPLPTKTTFVHHIKQTKKCSVELHFFKNFVMVNYPKGADCSNAFGHNATLEGVYYKVN